MPLPEQLTAGRVPGTAQHDRASYMHVVMGPSLTHYTVRWLDAALRADRRSGRLSDLALLNDDAARVHEYRELGLSFETIADRLHCSVRTAKSRAAEARAYLLRRIHEEETDPRIAAVEALRVQDVQAWTVLLLKKGGHTHHQIASLLGVDVSTVDRASVKAQKVAGEWDVVVWRRYARELLQGLATEGQSTHEPTSEDGLGVIHGQIGQRETVDAPA